MGIIFWTSLGRHRVTQGQNPPILPTITAMMSL